ncbi:MAG: 16S rRNA (adenine(1518)-N(6)/adenine(1519)-N(6))-dimethyltransferase RsmA [Sciscionella sp.]|nr:16S rRNA (adenine(1518)-N(6)/adenine(1519)-N(6))-dimethyltransferase RsmA [Sciscionella sp.]
MGDEDVRLLTPVDVRALARRLGIRPTKKLGQNFVHDPNTVRRIVATAEVSPSDVVLEVGPGLGSLTLALLPNCRQVIAVEIDPTLARALPETARQYAGALAGRLLVRQEDAIRTCVRQYHNLPTALVANLPYNVAVPVLLHLLAELPSISSGLVMVQAEVADRLVARPGGRIYGAPSVKLAWYARVRKAGSVPRTVFWPVPNVDSALVRFERVPARSPVDRDVLFSLVDGAFQQRRKTLRAALAEWAGSVDASTRLLDAAGIASTARGEQLSVDDFVRLAESASAERPVQ